VNAHESRLQIHFTAGERTLNSLSDSTNLDVLRSYAVLAVAASHFYEFCGNAPRFQVFMHNFGVCGVCFFFVHTSLVLFGSMARTKTSNLTRNFYIRRGFRIYPLCWVSILLVLTTGLTDQSRENLVGMGWRGMVANVALVQNITHSGDVLGPLWSLPWEVQMYLVLPALFLFLKKSRRPILFTVATWLGITIFAVVVTTFKTPSLLHAAIYPPMFLGGIVAFHAASRIRPTISSFAWLLFVPALIVLRCWMLQGDLLENPYNVAVNAAICLFLGFAIPQFKPIQQRLVTRTAGQIAKYSYGIYLFHVPALAFIFKYFPSYPIAFKLIALVVLTGVASVSSYYLVEHPLIRFGKHFAERLDRSSLVAAAD
jgi:peptidoglycan/LPS O-acetylase OafA/YrhL